MIEIRQGARLVYASESVRNFSDADLTALVGQSHKNNARKDITGALVYHEGWFVQVLEGHRLAVTELFVKIAQDPRHTSVSLLGFEEADTREFGGWGMVDLKAEPAYLKAFEQHAWSLFANPMELTGEEALRAFHRVAASKAAARAG